MKGSETRLRKGLAERTGSLVAAACLSTIAGLTYLALLMQIPIRLIVLGLVETCALACAVGVVMGFRARRRVAGHADAHESQ